MHEVNYAFAALWGGWLLFWLVSARGNKLTAVHTSRLWQFTALALVFVVGLGFRQFPDLFGRRWLPASAVWVSLGLALTACGLAFTVWARRVLGTNWSAIPSLKIDHELIQRGPYRVVRHPIYTGLLLAGFGSCLAGDRVWNLCVVGMATVLLIMKLKVEEALLAGEFPDAYRQYRRRTKALIPFLY